MKIIINDRNKQYIVKTGSYINVDKLNLNEGDIFYFKNIMVCENNNEVFFGNPFLKNIIVKGQVLKTYKNNKITILKFKRRKHYMKKIGHRQKYTKIKIVSIYNT